MLSVCLPLTTLNVCSRGAALRREQLHLRVIIEIICMPPGGRGEIMVYLLPTWDEQS
jgi:hypothetical protein